MVQGNEYPIYIYTAGSRYIGSLLAAADPIRLGRGFAPSGLPCAARERDNSVVLGPVVVVSSGVLPSNLPAR